LLGNRAALRDAIAAKRAQMACLEAAWVVAAETDIARHLGHAICIDDRGTWDKPTWSRYLAAAEAHEPAFKPRIRRLLDEIASIERLLEAPPRTEQRSRERKSTTVSGGFISDLSHS
jgi:hypothetical protein